MRAYEIDADLLERMSFDHPGREIELSPTTAYLNVDGTTWYALLCACPPCPGRGNDGHGLTHCAECCFGSGVEADIDCPTHGKYALLPEVGA